MQDYEYIICLKTLISTKITKSIWVINVYIHGFQMSFSSEGKTNWSNLIGYTFSIGWLKIKYINNI